MRKSATLLLTLCLSITAYAQSPKKLALPQESDSTDPISSFQPIVKRFEAFFSAPRKLIYLDKSLSSSPTGNLVYLEEASVRTAIGYDVQKTNSLISRYLGVITADLVWKSTLRCGDVKSNYGLGEFRGIGWSTVRGALGSDRPECYHYEPFDNTPTADPIRFVFTFQFGKWVFKDTVGAEDGVSDNYNILLSIWAEVPFPVTKFNEPEAEALNSAWRDLIH